MLFASTTVCGADRVMSDALVESPPLDPNRPEWSLEIEADWLRSGLTQTAYGVLFGRRQQAVSSWIKGTRIPPRSVVQKIIRRPGVRRAAFRDLLEGGDSALTDDYSAAREELFREFFDTLSKLYEGASTFMNPHDVAWRVHVLWTRAVVLESPPTLIERIDMVVQDERRRLQRRDEQS